MITYDKKTQVGKYEVQISTSEQYGWFEHDIYGDEAGGSLTFEDNNLEDFDGMMVLPEEVADAILELGFQVDKDIFC